MSQAIFKMATTSPHVSGLPKITIPPGLGEYPGFSTAGAGFISYYHLGSIVSAGFGLCAGAHSVWVALKVGG